MQSAKPNRHVFSLPRIVTVMTIMLSTASMSFAQTVATKPATMKKPQVSVEILSQDKYEGKMDGKETTVTVVELTLDPLAGGTPHRHPGPVNGYILEGTYEFQVEGGPVRTLKAGDTFFEPAMILHKVSRNPDKVKRARVLATMVHPSDVESLTIRESGDEPQSSTARSASLARAAKPTPLTASLPIVGLLLYDGVLQTEITAPSDVFSKHSEDGKQLFSVITIGPSYDLVTTEEGLHLFPDYTFDDAPKLDVIVVPSSYDMLARVKDERLVRFIQSQDANTKYTVSNCGGASLIGASGIAKGKKIVTWVGGGKGLQANYPELKVQDDAKVSFVEDGKLLSSNGNLASYISALELLEKMTSKEHRKFVESRLYLQRLRNWKDE